MNHITNDNRYYYVLYMFLNRYVFEKVWEER